MRKLLRKWLGISDDVAEIKKLCNANFIKIDDNFKKINKNFSDVETSNIEIAKKILNLEAENKYLNIKLQMLENGIPK